MELRLACRFAAPRHFGFCSSQTSPEAFPGDLRVLPLQKGKPQDRRARSPAGSRKPPPPRLRGGLGGARAPLEGAARRDHPRLPQESVRLRSDCSALEDHPRENYSSVKRPRALWRLGYLEPAPVEMAFSG